MEVNTSIPAVVTVLSLDCLKTERDFYSYFYFRSFC